MVFSYDMIGYNDSQQLPHTFGGPRESLWGLSLGGPAAVESHPVGRLPRGTALRPPRCDRRNRRIGRRNADVPAGRGRRPDQGGGPRQHDLTADAGRLPVRKPARAAARYDQRRDCRHDRTQAAAHGLGHRRLDVRTHSRRSFQRFAASTHSSVPRIGSLPFASTQNTTTTVSHARRCTHGWHGGSRTRRQTCGGPSVAFTPDGLNDLLVFHDRALPDGALSAEDVTAKWIDSSTRQLASTSRDVLGRALRHALGFGSLAGNRTPRSRQRQRPSW